MSDLPHGKGRDHLQVAITDSPADTPDGALGAVYVADCPISQNPAGEPIVIVGLVKHPDRGLHLRADAWAYMVGQLRAHATLATAGQHLQVEHLLDGAWIVSWTISPHEGNVLAEVISVAAAGYVV